MLNALCAPPIDTFDLQNDWYDTVCLQPRFPSFQYIFIEYDIHLDGNIWHNFFSFNNNQLIDERLASMEHLLRLCYDAIINF